jgi:sulfonate dioxygenase
MSATVLVSPPAVSGSVTVRSAEATQDSTNLGRPKKLQWWSETAQPGDVYPYEHFLPFFDQNLHLPPLTPFKHFDPGHEALKHADPLAFLRDADVDELTPDFGSEVSGIQLHQLDAVGRQQLALYVARRGVVVSHLSKFYSPARLRAGPYGLFRRNRLSAIKTLRIKTRTG